MRAHEFLYENSVREDIENFPIANVRRANGAIGTQGVNIEQAADVLTHAAGMQVSSDMSMRQLVDALKADPAAQQRLRQFVQKNPITVSALPDGSYHLQDGHHRTFLLNLLGDETVPAVVKEGVTEGKSNAMVNTASRLANKDDGKVAKLRAAGDKRREDQLKGRDIARRDRTSKDEWGYLKQGVAEDKQLGKPVVDAILKVVPIAQEIWFHGSRATGKHRKNSDTDILVVVPDDLVGDQYLGVVRILQKLSSHFDNYDIQPTHPGYNIHLIAQEEGRLLWSNKQDVAEDQVHEADASTVQFQTASTDNYQSSFTVTAIADGKNVGHFSFFRDPETDDVHNQAEVTDDVRGKGYGKALLLKAIEVANDHGLGFQEDSQSLSRAQSRVYDSLYDAGWIVDADGYWFLTPEGEQELARLSTIQQGVAENFHDGRNPGRKGLAKRSGVNTKASVSSLRKTAKNSSGEKQRMAHWLANMKAGRAKARRK